eukprot:m.46517 g.46517  ORF g.46517 m.46517 type:complete len:562 (+) comp20269_c0_seq1:253-1938(+)
MMNTANSPRTLSKDVPHNSTPTIKSVRSKPLIVFSDSSGMVEEYNNHHRYLDEITDGECDSDNPDGEFINERMKTRCATIETTSIQFRCHNNHEQINQYTLLEDIGKGSFGCVKLSKNERNGNMYAIKCLSKKRLRRQGGFGRHPKMQKTPNGLQALKHEIAILTKIRHPHVVQLFEVMDDDTHDQVYMVFELLQLGAIMNMSEPDTIHRIPEDQARIYFRQMLLAVEYLHSHGVIHRDIKPSNLLLYSNNWLKLSDFGVSHIFDGKNDVLSKTAGTPAFMAPETLQADSLNFEGRPVDVWAMGVTLHCFVLAKPPFVSRNIHELYTAIRENDVVFDGSSLSNELVDLLQKLLLKDPHERISIAQMRNHPWITMGGTAPLPSEQENCTEINVTAADVALSITAVQDMASKTKPHLSADIHSSIRTRATSDPGDSPFRKASQRRRNTPPTPTNPPKMPTSRVSDDEPTTSPMMAPTTPSLSLSATPRQQRLMPTETMLGPSGVMKFAATLSPTFPMSPARSSAVVKRFSPWKSAPRPGSTTQLRRNLRRAAFSNVSNRESIL